MTDKITGPAGWVLYETRAQQARGLAETVAAQLHEVLQQQGHMHLALPGGTTPGPFMQQLSQQKLDWQQLVLTLTDERQVPDGHERSNARLLREYFLDAAPAAQFIPLYQEHYAQQGFAALEHALKPILPLDVCVLGMGADGHFASLFPGIEPDVLASGLDPQNKQAAMAIGGEAVPEPRISLTLAALLEARYLHLLITGQEKKDVLEQQQALLSDAGHVGLQQPEILPIAHLLAHAAGRVSIHYCAG